MQTRIQELNGIISAGKNEISEKREQAKKPGKDLEKMAEVLKTNQPLIDEYNRFYFQKRRENFIQSIRKRSIIIVNVSVLKQHLDKMGRLPDCQMERRKKNSRW